MTDIRTDPFKVIQMKPVTQLIQGKQITYSLLSKRQENFSIFANDRFLYLKGIESINYASQIDGDTKFPFKSEADLPKAKKSLPLTQIQKCTGRDKLLTLKFSREIWEFECLKETCAIAWAEKINLAIQEEKDFKVSGYDEYTEYKAAKMQAIRRSIRPVPPQLTNSPPGSANSRAPAQLPFHESSVMPLETAVATPQRTSTPMPLPISLQPQINNEDQSSTPRQKRNSVLSMNKNESVVISGYPRQEEPIEPIIRQEQAIFIKENTTPHSNRSSEYTFQGKRDTADPQQSIFDSPLPRLSAIEEEDNRNRVQSSASSSLFHNDVSHSGIKEGLNQLDALQQNYSPRPPDSFNLNTDEYNQIDTMVLNKQEHSNILDRSISKISINGKQELKNRVGSERRNWCQQLVDGAEQIELIIDFRHYVQQLVQVIISQLHVAHSAKIYPPAEWTQQYASYHIEDTYLQVFFYTEKHMEEKHHRYKQAVRTFKNFDYMLEVTQNQGDLFVPLMVMFEYKGFLGMARTVVAPPNARPRNQEYYQHMDKVEFERQAKVSPNVLLDQRKCKIVSFQRQKSFSKSIYEQRSAYFIDHIDALLPFSHESSGRKLLLRPQLVRDQDLEYTFSLVEPMGGVYSLRNLLDKKLTLMVRALQQHDDYFVNSKELSQMMHSFGLNIRLLGMLLARVRQGWLRDILQAQLAARCLKNFYRFDLQNCVLNQNERKAQNEKQSVTEKRRVISFLNVIFGNTEPTFRVWRSLNTFSNKHFGGAIWDTDYRTINTGYFLQAIQNHLNITLRPSIFQRRLFQSMNSLDLQDFKSFVYDVTPYNLDFTHLYEEIHEHLQEVDKESFHSLCSLLTRQTRRGTYLDLLKGQPIFSQISEYLLNFVSPRTNPQTYRKIELTFAPSRYLYKNKMAEIKWLLQEGNFQNTAAPVNFIINHASQWLGRSHPVLLELHRVMGQFFSERPEMNHVALKHAQEALEIHKYLLGKQEEALWRDYFLLAKAEQGRQEHETALTLLMSAKKLVNLDQLGSFQDYGELCLALSRCYTHLRRYKEAYLTVRDLYRLIKDELNRDSLQLIVEAVTLMKVLLSNSQQHQTYFRFVESQFAHTLRNFQGHSSLYRQSVELIAFPYLTNLLLKRGRNSPKLAYIIDEICKMPQPQNECLSYLHHKTQTGIFPAMYCQSLRNMDRLSEEIASNDMVGRWKSFSRMSNDSLLGRIENTESMNRGFQWLADLTAVVGLIGAQRVRDILFGK